MRSEWCKLFLRAAAAADAMQSSLRRASTDDISDLDFIEPPSGSPVFTPIHTLLRLHDSSCV